MTMRGVVLIADSVEDRAAARAEQLQLEGWDTLVARDSVEFRARAMPGIEVVVFGELRGSAGVANDLVRELRSGRISGLDRAVRVIATADSEPQMISALGGRRPDGGAHELDHAGGGERGGGRATAGEHARFADRAGRRGRD